jgi:hypothetical protein
MKKEVKKLFEDFPELIEILIDFRKNKEFSYQEISNYFNELGYKCSRKLISRLYEKYIELIPRTRKGKNNSFYNKKHSNESKLLISETRKQMGYGGSKNPMYGKSGSLCPAWKGGKSSRTILFYSSSEWSKKRLEIMKIDSFTCLKCGEGADNKHSFLNVHHIIPLSVSWEERLNNDNLITLCLFCHKETFGKETEMIDLFQDIVRTHRRL